MNITTLKEKYYREIVPALKKEFSLSNDLAVSKPTKVTVNMGLGAATKDNSLIEIFEKELALITAQKPARTVSRKSISEFNLRKGEVIGLKSTLRGDKMWYFLDELINIVLPRVKDFRGISSRAFDKDGNYTLGITEHLVFPEIDPSRVTKIKGLSVAITFNSKNVKQNRALMDKMGFIFKKEE